MITLSSFVVLGTAVPELTKSNGKTVCLAGWSDDLGLVRIYPFNAISGIKRWDVLTNVKIKRNPKDNRIESYKIEELDSISVKDTIKDPVDKRFLLESIASECVFDVRDNMLSLGVVKVSNSIKCNIVSNPSFDTQKHIESLNEQSWLRTKRDFENQPSLSFVCGDNCKCKASHRLTVVEWGAFEWLRKNPEKAAELEDNWKLNREDYDTFLLLGNVFNQRTSFIVISVIPISRKAGLNYPLFRDFTDKRSKFNTNNVQHSVSKMIQKVRQRQQPVVT